ncbi:uncharacterized protein LOC119361830 isoform X2 [Triticum dicoccoides]|uniref:uncharacterized protein LOC119361830 isoform X2 n=1 Tax=Triticum dicoccoides TaxID=85692 RepID=UPI00188E6C82|nr:uncharacterized protein LOC119361830 isoform X2 [Triticum dicoccoides]
MAAPASAFFLAPDATAVSSPVNAEEPPPSRQPPVGASPLLLSGRRGGPPRPTSSTPPGTLGGPSLPPMAMAMASLQDVQHQIFEYNGSAPCSHRSGTSAAPVRVSCANQSAPQVLDRTPAAVVGWCSGHKNTLGNIESGLLGRHPRLSSSATSSTKAPSSPTTPLPSSMHTQDKLAVMMKELQVYKI